MNRNILFKFAMVSMLGLGAVGAHQSEAAGYSLGDTANWDEWPSDLTVVADADQFDNSGDPYFDDPYQDYYGDYYDQPTDSQDQGGGGGTDQTTGTPPEPCGGTCGGSFPLCDSTLDRCYRNGTNGEWRWRVDDWHTIPDPTSPAGIYISVCKDDALLYCDSSDYSAHPQRFNYSTWHECHSAGHQDLTDRVIYTSVAPNACCSYGASATNGRCYEP